MKSAGKTQKKDTEIRARVTSQLKAEASAVLASIGLTPSGAYRLLLLKVVQEKGLPFEPLLTPNQETLDAIQAARRGEVKPVASTAALFKDLDEESED